MPGNAGSQGSCISLWFCFTPVNALRSRRGADSTCMADISRLISRGAISFLTRWRLALTRSTQGASSAAVISPISHLQLVPMTPALGGDAQARALPESYRFQAATAKASDCRTHVRNLAASGNLPHVRATDLC